MSFNRRERCDSQILPLGKSSNLWIIMEYCPYGNLRVFLRKGRSRYSVGGSLMADLSQVIGPKNLIYFAWQITKGMAFLISRKVRILLNFLSISDLLPFPQNINYTFRMLQQFCKQLGGLSPQHLISFMTKHYKFRTILVKIC